MEPVDSNESKATTLRLPTWLWTALVAESQRRGISFNALVCVLLEEAVSRRRTAGGRE